MKRVLFLCLLSIVLGSARCGGGDDPSDLTRACTANTEVRKKSVNGFDYRPASPYYNQVVANFAFTQTSTTYTDGTNCKPMDCVTSLRIQNRTGKRITFDYNIIFTLNFASWNYQNVAVIEPGATVDVGEISENCASLSLGQILIQSASIIYQ